MALQRANRSLLNARQHTLIELTLTIRIVYLSGNCDRFFICVFIHRYISLNIIIARTYHNHIGSCLNPIQYHTSEAHNNLIAQIRTDCCGQKHIHLYCGCLCQMFLKRTVMQRRSLNGFSLSSANNWNPIQTGCPVYCAMWDEHFYPKTHHSTSSPNKHIDLGAIANVFWVWFRIANRGKIAGRHTHITHTLRPRRQFSQRTNT